MMINLKLLLSKSLVVQKLCKKLVSRHCGGSKEKTQCRGEAWEKFGQSYFIAYPRTFVHTGPIFVEIGPTRQMIQLGEEYHWS